MKSNCKHIFLIAMILFCICVPQASALTIVTHFMGGVSPANAVGSGNLEQIVNAAAKIWESAYSDEMVLTLYYGWANVGDAGTHNLQQADSLGREISGTILFDDSGSVSFYLDPTPNSSEEYRLKAEEYQDLGSGMMNVARIFSNPVPEIAGHVDLFSVALHEIGHALGLSTANSRFLNQSAQAILIVSGELPYVGSLIPLAYNNSGVIAHFDPTEITYGSVMAGLNSDERRIPSELDILAEAQVSGFAVASLNPQPAPQEVVHTRGLGESGDGSSVRNGSALRAFSSTPESISSQYGR